MVSKLRYIHFVYFLIGFQLVCYDEYECTNSSVISSADTINTIVTTAASLPMEARKLLSDDENESISTSDSNSLSDSSELLTNEQQITKHESQYYNEPTTTIGYEQPSYTNYNHHSPVHHHVIALHMAKPMNQTYFTAPLLTTPYTSTNSFLPSGNHLRIVKITNSQPWSSSPSPALSSLSPQLRLPLALPPLLSPPSHELTYLGNQYIASFRNIKSSVMNIIYKLQDFMSYVMNFFTMDETSTTMTEARGKKKIPKFKIKKKFKKFLIPLLLAYKLKFFALIPLIIGGLILLVGSTGMAGFFFALFTAVISLKPK